MAAADDSPDEAVTAARVQRRMADLAEAQVHATLALAAVPGISTGLTGADMAGGGARWQPSSPGTTACLVDQAR
jgi:hypothetical protein